MSHLGKRDLIPILTPHWIAFVSFVFLLGGTGCDNDETVGSPQPIKNVETARIPKNADLDQEQAENQGPLPGMPDPSINVHQPAAGDGIPKPSVSISEPLTAEEMKTVVDDYVTPDQVAKKAFAPPPGAVQLSPSNLWIDRGMKRVYADGYIAMNDGPLEMFACPAGTKEHESVVASLANAKEIHTGLLAIGAESGKPVQFRPEFAPASGQRIRVWICYLDEEKEYHVADGRSWIKRMGTHETLQHEWVFAGSKVWTDPSDGVSYYQADGGDMICVSNFGSALMDIQVESSANTDALQFEPFTTRIPKPQTPVRIVMEPIDEKATSAQDYPQPPQRETVFAE